MRRENRKTNKHALTSADLSYLEGGIVCYAFHCDAPDAYIRRYHIQEKKQVPRMCESCIEGGVCGVTPKKRQS